MYGPPGHPINQGPNPLNFASLEYDKSVGAVPRSEHPANPKCTIGTAESFFHYSNDLFNGHEVCDCYKNDPSRHFDGSDSFNQTENRVYRKGSTTIAYFQWFGDTVGPRGSVDFTPLARAAAQDEPLQQQCPPGQFQGNWLWKLPLHHFVANFVRSLKPTHVVIDAAFWPTQADDRKFWDDLSLAGASAVQNTHGSVFWRTVPLRNDYPSEEASSSVDQQIFFSRGWKLFDARAAVASFQGAREDKAAYSDTFHLNPAAESNLMWQFLQKHVCPAQQAKQAKQVTDWALHG